jgi:DNA ligase (NAD+)
LSEKTLRKLKQNLKIDNWYDLYSYTFDDFAAAGCGEKTALKIYTELEKSKTDAPAENVLMALGIPNIGKVNAKKLLEAFGSIEEIERIAKAVQVDLTQIVSHRRGYEIINLLGEVAGQNVVDYFNTHDEELGYVYKLFNTKIEKKEVSGNKLTGKIILATGTLKNFSRDGIKDSVVANGGTYASGISKKLDYLIVGEGAGPSKLAKAAELGLKQISENEYLEMIK